MKKHFTHDPGDTKRVTVIVYAMTEPDWLALSRMVGFRESSYEAWQMANQRHADACRKKGYRVIELELKPEEFEAWLGDNQKTARNRLLLEFGIHKLKEKD